MWGKKRLGIRTFTAPLFIIVKILCTKGPKQRVICKHYNLGSFEEL